MDESAVYHISMLDADIAAERGNVPPWTFETDGGQWYFETENEACAMQREYRAANGYDPITGEAV